jgi:hypothetical protein
MENTWLGPMETLPIKRRDISIMCSKQGENREHSFLSIAVMRKCGCSVWCCSGCLGVEMHLSSTSYCDCSSRVLGLCPGSIHASSTTLPNGSCCARSAEATSSSTACCWSTLPRWRAHHHVTKLVRIHNRYSSFPDGSYLLIAEITVLHIRRNYTQSPSGTCTFQNREAASSSASSKTHMCPRLSYKTIAVVS